MRSFSMASLPQDRTRDPIKKTSRTLLYGATAPTYRTITSHFNTKISIRNISYQRACIKKKILLEDEDLQTLRKHLGYSSESDNPSILLSISILLYFGALIMNMIMIIADKAIFKVKTSKNSKIFIF